MTNIDYFVFPLSPFCYLAGNALEDVAIKHGATVTYKPFALMQVFERTGGTPLGQRHISRQEYRLQELTRIAKMNSMPINLKPANWPTNPAPAAYAVIAAQADGSGDTGALMQAFLRAVWAEDKDIADDAVVMECLRACGFDPALANSSLLSGAETFASNTEEAVSRNVFGAPSYLVDDQVFFGQDRVAHLDAYLSGAL